MGCYYPFFPSGRKGGDHNMEFLFELLKEIAKAVVREVSAYLLRKQILNEDSKKPTLRSRRKHKGGLRKK
ncbi:hypothetical protein COO03_04820 [Bacillus sp. AFS098217]|nr:hypothetical protein COO03_04820 [Bacillus sp. AFS098217]